jgi:hypothetical protein
MLRESGHPVTMGFAFFRKAGGYWIVRFSADDDTVCLEKK